MTECTKCKRPIRLDECNMTSECYMTGSIHCLTAEASYRRAIDDAIAIIHERSNPDGWCDTMEIVEALREMVTDG